MLIDQSGFHLAADNCQVTVNNHVDMTFHQALTATLDGLPSNDSLPWLQHMDVRFTTISVNQSSMTLTVSGNVIVEPISG